MVLLISSQFDRFIKYLAAILAATLLRAVSSHLYSVVELLSVRYCTLDNTVCNTFVLCFADQLVCSGKAVTLIINCHKLKASVMCILYTPLITELCT